MTTVRGWAVLRPIPGTMGMSVKGMYASTPKQKDAVRRYRIDTQASSGSQSPVNIIQQSRHHLGGVQGEDGRKRRWNDGKDMR